MAWSYVSCRRALVLFTVGVYGGEDMGCSGLCVLLDRFLRVTFVDISVIIEKIRLLELELGVIFSAVQGSANIMSTMRRIKTVVHKM